MSNIYIYYIYWVKKRIVWMFKNREERDKDNETGLKEERRIQIESYSALFVMLALLSLLYLPSSSFIHNNTVRSRNLICR